MITKHVCVQDPSSVLSFHHRIVRGKVHSGAHPPGSLPKMGSEAAAPGDHHTSAEMLCHSNCTTELRTSPVTREVIPAFIIDRKLKNISDATAGSDPQIFCSRASLKPKLWAFPTSTKLTLSLTPVFTA